MRKPNIKLLQSVHSEARIHKNSQILELLNDVDSLDYFINRMIEAVRMAQKDPTNADGHLCLVSQLTAITRAKLREEKIVSPLTEALKSDNSVRTENMSDPMLGG